MHPLAAAILGIVLSFGGTVGLVPPEGSSPDPGDGTPGQPDAPGRPEPVSGGAVAVGLAAIAAALAAVQRRRQGPSPAAGLGLVPTDPVFVFVPGHGQPEGRKAFEEMVAELDLPDEAVRHFDYRWVDGGPLHRWSSRTAGVDAAATALNAFVAGVAADGRGVYMVGFSKGGATVAELISDWDDGRWGPSGSVVGAALLDPPMASGALGWLQSAGRFVGPIPDDGGYDPVDCRFLGFWCEDRRDHLGEESGIDVVVIRNPRAAITSFADVPDGLEVYDADDGGPGPWAQLVRNPFGLVSRITEAHESVLGDPRVASCIALEAWGAGECDLPRRRQSPPLPSLRRPAVRPPAGRSVL